jgi:hypothetical protein
MENQPSEAQGFQVFDNVEDLSASMAAEQEPQVETTEPVAEPAAQPAPEPAVESQPEESAYVDPEAAPTEETQEYTDSDYEEAVLSYMSERLGRQFDSFDDFSAPQQNALDERIEAIARFVEETGRTPEDWFAYQSLNPSEMDDMTAIRVSMASQYSGLSAEELNTLVQSKYKVDPDLNSEEEVRLAQIQLKVDAQAAREKIEELRSNYQAPSVQSNDVESIVDAVVDNIDAIVASAYKQGLGDGQRTLVDKAANVQSQTPTETGAPQSNPFTDQLKQIISGQGGRMTFKI